MAPSIMYCAKLALVGLSVFALANPVPAEDKYPPPCYPETITKHVTEYKTKTVEHPVTTTVKVPVTKYVTTTVKHPVTETVKVPVTKVVTETVKAPPVTKYVTTTVKVPVTTTVKHPVTKYVTTTVEHPVTKYVTKTGECHPKTVTVTAKCNGGYY